MSRQCSISRTHEKKHFRILPHRAPPDANSPTLPFLFLCSCSYVLTPNKLCNGNYNNHLNYIYFMLHNFTIVFFSFFFFLIILGLQPSFFLWFWLQILFSCAQTFILVPAADHWLRSRWKGCTSFLLITRRRSQRKEYCPASWTVRQS